MKKYLLKLYDYTLSNKDRIRIDFINLYSNQPHDMFFPIYNQENYLMIILRFF